MGFGKAARFTDEKQYQKRANNDDLEVILHGVKLKNIPVKPASQKCVSTNRSVRKPQLAVIENALTEVPLLNDDINSVYDDEVPFLSGPSLSNAEQQQLNMEDGVKGEDTRFESLEQVDELSVKDSAFFLLIVIVLNLEKIFQIVRRKGDVDEWVSRDPRKGNTPTGHCGQVDTCYCSTKKRNIYV